MKNLFAYDSAGTVIVLTDGRWLLVHGGADESPLWKKELESEPVGVAAVEGCVAALEVGGKLTFWDSRSGDPRGIQALSGTFIGLASARSMARFLAATSESVVVAEPGADPRSLAAPDTTAAALAHDGKRIAVGTASGKVKILTAGGEPVGESQVDGAVSSLCWGGMGKWLLTCGDRILELPPEGGQARRVTQATDMVPSCIAASDDGRMFAVRVKPSVMMALAYPSLEAVVQLRYPEREIAGVGFGPGVRPGLALTGGDGNLVDVMGEQLLRTDTFPGRTHNRWLVNVVIKPDRLAPAAQAAKPASSGPPSPASPPASAATPRAAPSTGPSPAPSKRGNWAIAIVVVVLLLNLIRWLVR